MGVVLIGTTSSHKMLPIHNGSTPETLRQSVSVVADISRAFVYFPSPRQSHTC